MEKLRITEGKRFRLSTTSGGHHVCRVFIFELISRAVEHTASVYKSIILTCEPKLSFFALLCDSLKNISSKTLKGKVNPN